MEGFRQCEQCKGALQTEYMCCSCDWLEAQEEEEGE